MFHLKVFDIDDQGLPEKNNYDIVELYQNQDLKKHILYIGKLLKENNSEI